MSSITGRYFQSLKQRALRVVVSPVPSSFAERQTILQVLEQHGPIEVFRLTAGFTSNFVSVTKDVSTASKLIKSSPLSYAVQVPRNVSDLNLAGRGTPNLAKQGAQPSSSTTTTETPPSSEEDDTRRDQLFTISVYAAPELCEKNGLGLAGDRVEGVWPELFTRETFMSATLKQTVPNTLAAEGLTHWDFDLDGKQWSQRRKAERQKTKGRWEVLPAAVTEEPSARRGRTTANDDPRDRFHNMMKLRRGT